jgi:trigger factor
MEEYATVKEHDESNITLLCDRHHREKTNGLLPVEKVREADKNPWNRREGESAPVDLHYSGGECHFFAGGCYGVTSDLDNFPEFSLITVRDTPLMACRFEDEHLLLSIQVFDDNNQRLLWIDRNELKYATTSWDVEWIGQVLRIRQREREIFIELKFSPPNRVDIIRGYLQRDGAEFLVRPNGLYFLNNAHLFRYQRFVNLSTAFYVGEKDTVPLWTGIHIDNVNWDFSDPTREGVVEIYRTMGQRVTLKNGRFFASADPSNDADEAGQQKENPTSL